MKSVSQHLSSTQVADILDERLDPGDRDAVVTHLAACAECRREVAVLHGALSSVNERRTRSRWAAAAALTAVAAAVVTFAAISPLVSRRENPRQASSETRSNAEPSMTDVAAGISAVEPSDGGTLSTASRFTWNSACAGASYVITVQDVTGAVVWTNTVTDTSAALPANVLLTAGSKYFWSVDARFVDGSSSRSSAHSFIAR